LLSGLDSNLSGFKDRILVIETLPVAVMLILDQCTRPWDNVPLSLPQSSSLVSSSSSHGSSRGGFCDGHGGHGFHGRNRTGGCGDKKCDHCGGTNHSEPYYWVKDGKPDSAMVVEAMVFMFVIILVDLVIRSVIIVVVLIILSLIVG
jgi:hypothetical protein